MRLQPRGNAFLSEEETESRTKALSKQNDAPGMEEVQGELDDVVNDLNKEWSKLDEQPEENEIDAAMVSVHANTIVMRGTSVQMEQQSPNPATKMLHVHQDMSSYIKHHNNADVLLMSLLKGTLVPSCSCPLLEGRSRNQGPWRIAKLNQFHVGVCVYDNIRKSNNSAQLISKPLSSF